MSSVALRFPWPVSMTKVRMLGSRYALIFSTSASCSAGVREVVEPAMMRVMSTTRMPERGRPAAGADSSPGLRPHAGSRPRSAAAAAAGRAAVVLKGNAGRGVCQPMQLSAQPSQCSESHRLSPWGSITHLFTTWGVTTAPSSVSVIGNAVQLRFPAGRQPELSPPISLWLRHFH